MSPLDNTVHPDVGRLSADAALALADNHDVTSLARAADDVRRERGSNLVTYSRKVFIPLTQLCRDVCHYCTFAQTPKRLEKPFLLPEDALAIARKGAAQGCKEALFTMGERPEHRYSAAREALNALGHETTLSYLGEVADLVYRETGLLPHLNAGTMSEDELIQLRPVSVSQGLMLESVSERLCTKGEAHYGSPDKMPEARLQTLHAAGRLRIPYTTGLLIGIGETRLERIEALLEIRKIHDRYGHIQEIIVQNFRAKPGTRMTHSPEPDLDELVWTVAVARLIMGPSMHIQAPPNLTPTDRHRLLMAGVDDWGGISPVTPDHVNPEAPWPHLEEMAEEARQSGRVLTERLTAYPEYVNNMETWFDPQLHKGILALSDSSALGRPSVWHPGHGLPVPNAVEDPTLGGYGGASSGLSTLIERASQGKGLGEDEIVRLFEARGGDFSVVCTAADDLRQKVSGDNVTYVINRNINYTNICSFKCGFCAFSKGKTTEHLRGKPYDLPLEEIQERTREAWQNGATEVCMQGGIHPKYTGETYLRICNAVKEAVPEMHIHAFSPLEVTHGAESLGLGIPQFLRKLKSAGLGTLPGTAAEILDDEVRRLICPGKLTTQQWLDVIEAAHGEGLPTTSTIMFGHVDAPRHWARHLIRLRALQSRTGGITEFVPLPFVHMEAPMYLKGRARRGPTYRETVLMHAVARLVLHPLIPNIQTSWVKMGDDGIEACLNAGANDLGGTLMNESITRAAGGTHGQEMTDDRMSRLIDGMGRTPRRRNTIYQLQD